MLNGLMLWNFGPGSHPEEEITGPAFILKTCQRSMVLAYSSTPFKSEIVQNHELVQGEEAYLFLLETICGLKSKLIGENEIVGQFKQAYQTYVMSTLKDTKLLLILEKLFKDAKDIRTQYLIGISQKTYASLTRKHIIQKGRATHVVIVGSGNLAEDLINQLKKKASVSICARNSQRVYELAKIHSLNVIPWENRSELVNEPFIANTVGHEDVLFDKHFFDQWSASHKNRVFVDLGSPSVIETSLTLSEGVVRLEDIFNQGAIVEGQKVLQIELARKAMHEISAKRKDLLEAKFASSSPDLAQQTKTDVRYL